MLGDFLFNYVGWQRNQLSVILCRSPSEMLKNAEHKANNRDLEKEEHNIQILMQMYRPNLHIMGSM